MPSSAPPAAQTPAPSAQSLPTGSKLPLLLRCAYPWRAGVPHAPQASRAADTGSEVHAYIDAMLRGEPAPAIGDEAQGILDACAADIDRILAGCQWASEVPLAWCPTTGRGVVLSGRGREYGDAPAGWLVGCADAVAVDAGVVRVIDWKTGQRARGISPEDNAQLYAYAAAAMAALGADSARVEVVALTPQGAYSSAVDLDAFDLADLAGRISARLASIPTATPQPGPWCADMYCPAAAACPAAHAAQDALVSSAAEPTWALATPEQATALHARLALAEAACEQARAMLKAYARDRGPIPTADGKLWGRRIETRDHIPMGDARASDAEEVLARHGCLEAVETKHSVTWSRIRSLIAARCPAGRSGAKQRREAEDALRADLAAAGALSTVEIERYDTLKAG